MVAFLFRNGVERADIEVLIECFRITDSVVGHMSSTNLFFKSAGKEEGSRTEFVGRKREFIRKLCRGART